MGHPARKTTQAEPPKRPFNFWARLKEIDMFFEGRGKEHKTMRRLVENLKKAKIPYAIMGGMAVNAHRHERTTKDVDVLLTGAGFAEFRRRFVPRAYDPVAGRLRRFLDRRYQVTFDVLVTGLFPGSGEPGPIAFPDPAEVSQVINNMLVVNLPTLIQLKLAARRPYDFGDVVSLVRLHKLNESFRSRLHPSVHRDFIECLEEMRRQDEYEARQDRQMEELERGQQSEKSNKRDPYPRRRG
jgi:hypothetical protein